MTLSPNKRFLAVCERHKNDHNAYLSFYDMKSGFRHIKQSLNISELITPFPSSNQYVNQSAGKDASHIVTQSGANMPAQRVIVSLKFSQDSKYVAFIVTDGVDCKAVAYDWFHKARVFGHIDFPKSQIKRISFNPKDNHQVCTSGHNHWKLWRVQENTFKPMQ